MEDKGDNNGVEHDGKQEEAMKDPPGEPVLLGDSWGKHCDFVHVCCLKKQSFSYEASKDFA